MKVASVDATSQLTTAFIDSLTAPPPSAATWTGAGMPQPPERIGSTDTAVTPSVERVLLQLPPGRSAPASAEPRSSSSDAVTDGGLGPEVGKHGDIVAGGGVAERLAGGDRLGVGIGGVVDRTETPRRDHRLDGVLVLGEIDRSGIGFVGSIGRQSGDRGGRGRCFARAKVG